ncbi:redoxin domain-containing protein [Dokdonia ponticola]|uniref:Redoxin domain-containing protein n=1 Tax=Dokdonia ponticola TaxID=2041041 RepID=A0ABV9HZN0_9FLAO
MQKIIILIFAITLLCGCKQEITPVNETEAQIGFKVPNIAFKQLLNDSQTQSNLYGYTEDIIILDFWATWCGPCITSFPKMSALQETFGKQIKIIAVTDESPERIELFLKNKPQQFTVAIDNDKSINTYFTHAYIPHYVILDRNKVIKAIVDGDYITKENITKLIAGEQVIFKEKKENLAFDPNKPLGTTDKPIVYQSTLLPYNPDLQGMSNLGSPTSNRLFMLNTTFTSMLQRAYQYSYNRTKEHLKHPEKYTFTPENRYSYEMIYPDYVYEQRLELVKNEIKALSGLSATIETQVTDVYVLQKIPNTKISIPISSKQPDPNAFVRYGEGITLQGDPMERLRDYYEEVLLLPVVDETGYDKVYDIEVKWFEENQKQSLAELTKYGLELKKAKRPIDFLIIAD